MTTSPGSIIAVLIACVLGAFASILMKKASHDFTFNIRKILKNKALIFAVLLYGISTVIFVPALRYGELSVLYPFVATTYVWVSLLSIRFLNEKMNPWKWAGIGLILLGVAAIGLGS
ncbi:MAG: EamA family transporter [Nanoarchaeota archaeon]